MTGKTIILGNRIAIIPWRELCARKIKIYKTSLLACIHRECRVVWSICNWDDIPYIDELFDKAEKIYRREDVVVCDTDYEFDVTTSAKYQYLMYGKDVL